MADLELIGLEKAFGETKILQGIDLKIADGEFVVLVGPSGCGKSTLLRCIAGLEDISAGELKIAGERADKKPPKDRDCAMVFQSYALYPHLTVRDNMGFSLMLRKRPQAEITAKVNQAAEILGLENLLDRLPKQLSGGQRQRVAIARALAVEPKLVIADEPTANLDSENSRMVVDLMRDMNRARGVTFVFTTHDPRLLEHVDRKILLRDGSIESDEVAQ